jgi:hypothetical protein
MHRMGTGPKGFPEPSESFGQVSIDFTTALKYTVYGGVAIRAPTLTREECNDKAKTDRTGRTGPPNR